MTTAPTFPRELSRARGAEAPKLIGKAAVYRLPRQQGILVILPEMAGRPEIRALSDQEIRRFREAVVIVSEADYRARYADMAERISAPFTRWLAIQFAQDKART